MRTASATFCSLAKALVCCSRTSANFTVSEGRANSSKNESPAVSISSASVARRRSSRTVCRWVCSRVVAAWSPNCRRNITESTRSVKTTATRRVWCVHGESSLRALSGAASDTPIGFARAYHELSRVGRLKCRSPSAAEKVTFCWTDPVPRSMALLMELPRAPSEVAGRMRVIRNERLCISVENEC